MIIGKKKLINSSSLDDSKLELRADGLAKSYRRRKVVDDVSVTVKRGQVVGLLGPNGAGKTTTFYMIAGLIRCDAGNIRLDGKIITNLPMHKRSHMGLGYLTQECSVFRRMTVTENLRAVLEYSSFSKSVQKERMEDIIHSMHLEAIRDSFGFQLSGGESRRVEVARLLVLRPAYVLLDEPFAGVDPIAVMDIQEIIEKIRQQGIGVLVTDHNVRETLSITDRAYIINQGCMLAHGKPSELMENESVRRIYLGEHFQL